MLPAGRRGHRRIRPRPPHPVPFPDVVEEPAGLAPEHRGDLTQRIEGERVLRAPRRSGSQAGVLNAKLLAAAPPRGLRAVSGEYAAIAAAE